MKKRNEIEEKYKWDLTLYYNNESDWQSDYEYVLNNYKKILQYENKLTNDNTILKCLNFNTNISKIMGKLYVYASLKLRENMADNINQEKVNKIEKLSVEISTLSSFISVELSELDDIKLTQLSKNKTFTDYSIFFEDLIKNKKHMLSKKEEKLLAGTQEFAGDFSAIFDMYDTVDICHDDIQDSNAKTYKMNNSAYSKYMQSPDRTLRKNAYISQNGAYKKINKMLSANYIANVKANCFYAKIRNFESALKASIWSEDASEEVYNMLIKSVNANLKVFHRFFNLKAKILNVKNLAVYDMNVGTSSNTAKYSYEKAFDIVYNALSVLGDDYKELLQKAKNQRWIDVYANAGKDTGAFSWGAYGANPVVLLNHENTINCVFTLAHELGHAMHTYYSNKNQPYQKAGYEIFVAEVASTVNEMLLIKHLLDNAKNKNEKMFYLDYLMKMFVSTVFRQTMFAEFEQFAHASYESNQPTTADALNNFYHKLNSRYFGNNVKLLNETKYEWSRIPHFYSSFYVYKYATGLISAFYIADKIYNKDQNVLKNYKTFLSLGCTMPPVELLKVSGVNLEDKETFNYVFKQLDKLLDIYEQLI